MSHEQTDDNALETFVKATSHRRLIFTFEKVDPDPGAAWSMAVPEA